MVFLHQQLSIGENWIGSNRIKKLCFSFYRIRSVALHSFREQQVPSTDGVPQPGNLSGKFSDVAALHQRVQVIKPPHLISYILKDVEILYGVV